MDARPLLVLAALAAATSPDLGASTLDDLKEIVRRRFSGDPMGTVLSTVAVSAYLFYRAERGHNPRVTTYYDALVYVSTNLSVGYSDILAKTPAGKAIGSVLMTYGPAMAAGILDEPEKAPPNDPAVAHGEILARLDRLIEAIEARAT